MRNQMKNQYCESRLWLPEQFLKQLRRPLSRFQQSQIERSTEMRIGEVRNFDAVYQSSAQRQLLNLANQTN